MSRISLRQKRVPLLATVTTALALVTGPQAATATGATTDGEPRLTTIAGYLGRGHIPETDTSGYTAAGGQLYYLTYNNPSYWQQRTARSLDLTADTSTPVLGSGFNRSENDPSTTQALASGLYIDGQTVDSRGVLLAHADTAFIPDKPWVRDHNWYRIVATSKTTTTAYGSKIPADSATTVVGGGGMTGDGVWAPNEKLVECGTTNPASSSTGLLAVSTDEPTSTTWPQLCQVRIVPTTSGTYFGRPMQAAHSYIISADTAPGAFAFTPRGDLVTAQGDKLLITAVADGTAYGVQMSAGKTYTIPFTTSVATWDYTSDTMVIDSEGTIYWGVERSGTGGASVMVLPSQAMTRYGKRLTAGTAVQLLPTVDTFTVDEYGTVIYRLEGDEAVRALPANDGTLYGHAATAGQEVVLSKPTPLALAQQGADPLDLRFYARQVDYHAGDVLSLGTGGRYDSRSVFVPATSGTFFGKPMTAGRSYHVVGNGLAQGDTLIEDGVDATSVPITPRDAVLDRDGNIIFIGGNPYASPSIRQIYIVPRHDGTYDGRGMLAGHVYKIAGRTDDIDQYPRTVQPRDTALFDRAERLVVDGEGNIVIGDSSSGSLWVIPAKRGKAYGRWMETDKVYAVSYRGPQGSTTSGATLAQSSFPTIDGLKLEPTTGSLLVAGRDSVRVIARRDATLYGVPMRAGNVYTIPSGTLDSPTVAGTSDGRLLIGSGEATLLEVGTDGTVRTVAGQPQKSLFSPDGTPASRAYLKFNDLDVDAYDRPIMAGPAGIRKLR